jgi:hypothetical protein
VERRVRVGGARRAGGSSKSGRRASGCDRDLDATAASQEEEEKEEDGIGQSSAANLMFEREPFEIAEELVLREATLAAEGSRKNRKEDVYSV